MTSVLRQLQAEWNEMVPAAQARGIRRVRILGQGDVNRAPLETIAYRRAKVEWLRALLGGTAAVGMPFSTVGLDSLTFGVEIECILPTSHGFGTVADMITRAGVLCQSESYGHAVPANSWKVVTDGSLGNYSRGAEFVSPPLRGEDGFRQLKIVCDVLTSIRARITPRCGFHVHVGVADQQTEFFKNLVTLYHSAQSALDTIMPQSRRGRENVYCQPLRIVNAPALNSALSVDQVVSASGQMPGRQYARHSTRYCKLNLQSFFAYGTVEFRHHGGTTDARKAANWVRLCLRMVLTAKAGERQVSSLAELLDAVEADAEERAYFQSRVAFFQRDVVADRFAAYGSTTAPRAGRVG